MAKEVIKPKLTLRQIRKNEGIPLQAQDLMVHQGVQTPHALGLLEKKIIFFLFALPPVPLGFGEGPSDPPPVMVL